MIQYFKYGDKEIEHLKSVDKKLAKVIDKIGPIKREITPDLFTALVHAIVSQQISNKARDTVWSRIVDKLGEITPTNVHNLSVEELQSCGISFRKVNYIKSAAEKIVQGELDLDSLYSLSDDEVSDKLCQLNGIGPWTAEMLMMFSMQRPNILSFGDLAIKRAMSTLYNLDEIDKKTFNKYWKKYSPYASVASLYLWEISTGKYDVFDD